MRTHALAVLLCLTLADSATAARQGRTAARVATPCKLTLAEAPVVRGLKLGQTSARVLETIPTLERDPGPDEFGQTSYSHVTVAGKEALNPPGLRGVNMLRLTFLDDRLYYIVVSYSDYEPASAQEFVRQAAATLKLPAAGWRREEESAAVLTCDGFSVTVQTGREGRRVDYPSLIISDSAAQAEYRRRYEAAQAEKRRREIQRKRQEEERRRVFRP